MDVEQIRQDVAEGTVPLDRLVELIALQQKLIQRQQQKIDKLQEQIKRNPKPGRAGTIEKVVGVQPLGCFCLRENISHEEEPQTGSSSSSPPLWGGRTR